MSIACCQHPGMSCVETHVDDAMRIIDLMKSLEEKDAELKSLSANYLMAHERLIEKDNQIASLRSTNEAWVKTSAELRREKEAYREVAIKYGDILDDNRNIKRTAADVDSEANKLLSQAPRSTGSEEER